MAKKETFEDRSIPVGPRFRCLTLGHTEALIQKSLDLIEPWESLIAVLWVNTSAVGIIERFPRK